MLNEYRNYLISRGASRLTAKGYVSDVSFFAKWLEGTTGETFSVENVTPVDVREYVSYLTAVKRQKPASIARKVRALNNFFDWLVGRKGKDKPSTGCQGPKRSQETAQEPHRPGTVQGQAGSVQGSQLKGPCRF